MTNEYEKLNKERLTTGIKSYNSTAIKEGFNQCWSTPVYKTKFKDKKLLEKLVSHIIINYAGEDNNVSLNMKDRCLFEDNFFEEFKEKEVIPVFEEYLKKEVDINLKEESYSLRAWLTGSNTSYHLPSHNHSGSHISSVFYLLSEENNKGGRLSLSDSRFNANRTYGVNKKFDKWFHTQTLLPSTGDIIMFPCFVYHNVEPFWGKMRLALPVDLTLNDI